MKDRVCVYSFWAILMAAAFAMTGCVRVYASKAIVTAMPIYSAEDPEQPLGPSDYSGLIVSVTHERISIQQSPRQDVNVDANAAEPPDNAVSALAVPLANDVQIRQSRYAADGAEFVNLQPYEIVPGLHAEVWLDNEGSAAYIRVSVRVHLDELAERRNKW